MSIFLIFALSKINYARTLIINEMVDLMVSSSSDTKSVALPGLVGKMYSKIHSQERGGGTNHKDTKDTKIDHIVS